jgi:DNA repair protein RecO
MSRYSSVLAIVIRRQLQRESDTNYTLLTPTLGKITALAKNIRRTLSRRSGHLQLGNIVKVQLYSVNNRYWLSEATTVASFLTQTKNLTQFSLLFYFLEIINQSIAENQNLDGVYTVTKNLIESINANNYSEFINQEINLIKILGFGVPENIISSYKSQDYKNCQLYLKNFLESIIEKPLQSNKLFH